MTLPQDALADDAAVVALDTRLGRLLVPSGRMLATVESCTGGLIARALTETPGSSAWFDRGFITYSNQAKTDLVGVPEALLAQFGAVSEPVARAMAEGGLTRSAAFLTMSVTGVAGPGGGSPDKPVGLVCFGWALRGEAAQSVTHRFDGDRAAVRRQAALFALRGALQRVAPPPLGLAAES